MTRQICEYINLQSGHSVCHYRAKLANGFERRGRPGPQPPAADMEEMVSFNTGLFLTGLDFSSYLDMQHVVE